MLAGWTLAILTATGSYYFSGMPEYDTKDTCIAAAYATARTLNRVSPDEAYIIVCQENNPDEGMSAPIFDTYVFSTDVNLLPELSKIKIPKRE